MSNRDKRQRASRSAAPRGSARLRKLLRDYERMSAAGFASNRAIGGVNCCCCRHIHSRPNVSGQPRLAGRDIT